MDGWFSLWMQMMKLGMESQMIILHRLSRLQAGGPMAQREAARMVSEKTIAAAAETFAVSLALASGKSPLSALESTLSQESGRQSPAPRPALQKTCAVTEIPVIADWHGKT